jgi:tetratricopeptide (TPR) repeat protein
MRKLVLSLAISIYTTPMYASDGSLAKLIDSGTEQFKNRQYTKARSIYDRALRSAESEQNSQRSVSCIYNLALVDIATSSFHSAELRCKELLQRKDLPAGLNPNFIRGLLVQAYEYQFEYYNAEQEDKEIISSIQSKTDKVMEVNTLLHMGVMQIKQGKYKESAENLNRVQALCEKLPTIPGENILCDLYLRLGALNLDTNNLVASETYNRKCVLLSRKLYGNKSQKTADALSNLAELLRRRQKYAEARDVFKESLDANPTSSGTVDYFNGVGCVFLDDGSTDQAISCFEKAVNASKTCKSNSALAQSLSNLASAHAKSKQMEKAKQLFSEAISVGEQCKDPAVLAAIKDAKKKFMH